MTHSAYSKAVYAIATMDTKGEEIAYVASRTRAAGAAVLTVDVGTGPAPALSPDISREKVAVCHREGSQAVLNHSDRGQAVTAMSEALVAFLTSEHAAGKVAGVIGLGGTGGTALIAPALRALPIGLPKLLVSTVASGNIACYVGCCDITMMYSVVDIAGLNRVSRQVLGNAACAIAGMVQQNIESSDARTALGMTMFGVTTPCVTAVRERLEEYGYDCLVFHATGTGGQAMEKLVSSGMIDGVLDITTTEVADEVVGGVFRAGPERFEAILRRGIPYVMSLGAVDMVNFGARDTVPAPFRNRKLHVHNAQVTLMRTTPEENRQIARWIARKINQSSSRITVLIPEKGVSMLDVPGQPFHDPEADAALFEELEATVHQDTMRVIRRLPHHINDRLFASALVDEYVSIAGSHAIEKGS
ncbi:MAG: Tm-1-like ATP-binding domain-containing protein [Acidobacteria bacterium]|nr:Tm-1-like ATP-binding domain-containing protein [Acidobacteriota bacterium]